MGNSRGVPIDELPKELQQELQQAIRRARDGEQGLTAQTPVPFIPTGLGPNALVSAAVRTPRTRSADLEHPIQVEVVAWADDPATLPQYPELKSLYAIPNEVGAGGKRSARSRQLDGARKRASGRRKGMPDLCLPTPRKEWGLGAHVYGALYIEMKAESGTVRKSQRTRIAALRAAGNRCEVAMSAETAKAIITMYLHLPKP